MHKTKVVTGIVIIVIIVSIFSIDEISYQDCFKRSMESLGTIICHHFIDHILSLSYYSVVSIIGILLGTFGYVLSLSKVNSYLDKFFGKGGFENKHKKLLWFHLHRDNIGIGFVIVGSGLAIVGILM